VYGHDTYSDVVDWHIFLLFSQWCLLPPQAHGGVVSHKEIRVYLRQFLTYNWEALQAKHVLQAQALAMAPFLIQAPLADTPSQGISLALVMPPPHCLEQSFTLRCAGEYARATKAPDPFTLIPSSSKPLLFCKHFTHQIFPLLPKTPC
jgi:hypothetical protein